MKFIFATALAFSAIASVVALVRDPAVVAAVSNRKGLETRDPVHFENGTLSKRVCTPSPCDCIGFPGGIFCGDGNFDCTYGDVYQCNEDGRTTCNFGGRDSCADCGKLSCP